MIQAATLRLWYWPHWTYSISWLWTNPVSYNFWSSAWGEHLFDLVCLIALYLLLRPLYRRVVKHLECHVDGCTHIGYPVHGTGYRACHHEGHHPAIEHEDGEPVTAEHIRRAHEKAVAAGTMLG